jgi:hypothetical protein
MSLPGHSSLPSFLCISETQRQVRVRTRVYPLGTPELVHCQAIERLSVSGTPVHPSTTWLYFMLVGIFLQELRITSFRAFMALLSIMMCLL